MNKPVQNILMFLGFLFILEAFGITFFFIKSSSLDKGSKEFAEQAVLSIFSIWDYNALKNNSDPRLFEGSNEEAIKGTIQIMSKLGKTESPPDCRGQSAFNVGNDRPTVSAQYSCQLKFEKDTATIILYLVGDLGNHWKIGGLHVNSDYLMKQQPATAK